MSTLTVAEAAVIGMPNARLGEKLGAAVALKPGGLPVTAGELCAFVTVVAVVDVDEGASAQVAAYKYPRRVWFTAALPKGPTWKILNREIVEPDEEAAA